MFIIKKKNDDEYVTYNNEYYSITHNKTSALSFVTKKEALNIIRDNNLELHLMSNFIIIKKQTK